MRQVKLLLMITELPRQIFFLLSEELAWVLIGALCFNYSVCKLTHFAKQLLDVLNRIDHFLPDFANFLLFLVTSNVCVCVCEHASACGCVSRL